MVSLCRLLAAAEDSLLEEPATPLLLRTQRDCILPPALSAETVPQRLRQVLTTLPSTDSFQPSYSNSSNLAQSFRSPPLLPLQRILQDLGAAATAPNNMTTLARTLAHFGRPSEAAVASALLFLSTAVPPDANTVDTPTMFHLFTLFCGDQENATTDPTIQQAIASSNHSVTEWRVDVLVKAVVTVAAQFNSPLDWRLVIHSLDVEGLETQLTRNAFIEIAKAYIAGTNGNPLPADCLLDNWLHPTAQVCIISHALASPELINWDVLDLFDGATPEDAQVPYSRILLIEKLVELDARDLLQTAIQQSNEIVLISLTCAKPRNNANMQRKLTVTLLTSAFMSFPASEKALRQMWHIAPGLVESGLISLWKKDQTTIRRALAISIETQILYDLLSSNTSFEFSLDLALLAYQEGLLQFEKWLMKVLTARGVQAMNDCTVFMARKIRSDDPTIVASLSLDGVRIIFRCLATRVRNIANAAQAQELLDAVQSVHELYVRISSRLIDLSPASDVGDPKILLGSKSLPSLPDTNGENRTTAPPTSRDQPNTSEASAAAATLLLQAPTNNDGTPFGFDGAVDQEAQSFFKNLYERTISVDQAVEVLRRFRNSNIEHETQVFNCAMYTLFDEYRFFEKYPDQELRLTGMLFGSVIQCSLLTENLLGLAAKCVLDALRTVESNPQPLGRLVKFGLCALERFKGRIHEWPQYCSHILELPRLAQIAPDLIGRVRKAFERSGGHMPSVNEREIGLAVFEQGNIVDPMKSKLGNGTDITTRDSPNNTAFSRALIASPPPSATATPMKSRGSPAESPRASPSRTPDGTLGFSVLNLIELLGMTKEEANEVVTPDEITQDRIKFIFNNLSHDTMDQKVSEMLSILSNEYHRYFSVYIVVKRAPTEPNFHHLYLAMLERMSVKISVIFPMVFETSYRRVRVLLSGDKGRGTSAERQVLKNLGSWIGSLTIARNKPILRRDLDLKELLLDAYSNGRLTIIVPFVAKVLDACPRSKIFKDTNPWVRGILSLMKEIHEVPDFKLNIKFELQMLCKNVLKIDLNDIVPSDLLRKRPTPDKAHNADYNTKKTLSGSPPRTSPSPSASPSPDSRRGFSAAAMRGGAPVFNLMDSQPNAPTSIHAVAGNGPHSSSGRIDVTQSLMSGGINHLTSEGVGDLSNLLSAVSLSSANANNAYVPRTSIHSTAPISIPSGPQSTVQPRSSNGLNLSEPTIIPNLAQYITVSSSSALFQNAPNLKRLLPYAIDRAIREIIQPVVERSCAIAFLTTKELTLKDFATETDFNKVRRAAVQMVQQLAGSLALVTSKEPLRVSMNNQLVNILSTAVGIDQSVVDQAAQAICMSNLEVGCAVIERHAKEKAARDLTEKLTSAFFARRTNQQQSQQFTYNTVPGQDVLRVYEEFSRVNRLTQNQSQAALPSTVPTSVPASYAPLTNSVTTTPAPGLNLSSTPTQQLTRVNQTTFDDRTGTPSINSISGTKGSVSDTQQSSVRTYQDQVDQQNYVSSGNRQTQQSSITTPENPLTAIISGSPIPPLTSTAALHKVIVSAISAHREALSSSASSTGQSAPSLQVSEDETLSTQKVLERFNVVYPHLASIIYDLTSSDATKDLALSDIRPDHEIHSLWVQIPAAIKRSVTADEAGMAVAQKVFKGLYEGESNLHREVHVLLLEGLRESCKRLSKELVSWISFSEERKRFHKECTIALMRPASLLNKTSYDEALTKFIDNGRNINALDFACFIVRKAVLEEPLATQAEMKLTIDLMEKVGHKPTPPHLPSAPEGLLLLVDVARNTTHPTTPSSIGANNNEVYQVGTQKQARETEPNDPDELWQYIGTLLLEWRNLLTTDSPTRPVSNQMVSVLTRVYSEFLGNEDSRERFFRVLIELVVGVTATALHGTSPTREVPPEFTSSPYTCVEVAVRLVSSLCRFPELYTQGDSSAQVSTLLCGFLAGLVRNLLKKSSEADFRPHFRLFLGLISEVAFETNPKEERNGSVPAIMADVRSTTLAKRLSLISTRNDALRFLDDKTNGFVHSVLNTDNSRSESSFNFSNVKILAAFAGAFSTCSPNLIPGFAFSWLQLISSKEMLPNFLSLSNISGWPLYRHLLELILSFLSPFLEAETSMSRGITVLYRGLLRVLLVLLHDFPEFLCTYHMTFCDVIPENCVQLRNLVLASFPHDMQLPDPFSPDLKVEDIKEMAYAPVILSDYTSPLESTGLRNIIDKFLNNSSPFRTLDFVSEVEPHLLDTNFPSEKRVYSSKKTGSMVLYVGQQALRTIQSGDGHVMTGSATKFFVELTNSIAPEGRHAMLNAITNQLRYPNNNTMYYSSLMLLLFHDGDDLVKEQIARVLVERLIANRPHPWGLLITFVQLIKKSEYSFWEQKFVRCTPEIEQVFNNLAHFCNVPNEQQSIVMSS